MSHHVHGDGSLSHGEITVLLERWDEPEVLNQIIDLLYQDLRNIARRYLRDNSVTIQPTAMVHEVYQQLYGRQDLVFESRAHFFNCAALIMRQTIYRYASSKQSLKRGGRLQQITLDDVGEISTPGFNIEGHLALNDVLKKLKELDARKHMLVELRFYLGLTMAEIGQVLELTERSVRREWAFVRKWLARELKAHSASH